MRKGAMTGTLCSAGLKWRSCRMSTAKPTSQKAAPVLFLLFLQRAGCDTWGYPTSIPSTTMDTSEPSLTRQEEEQSGRQCAQVEEGTPESLGAYSKELFSSQEEGSQSWWPVVGEGQTPEELPNATLRSQLSMLSLAEKLQRIRKRPRRSKEDMLHEVMQHSLNENQKVQEWRESDRRFRQQNVDCWHQSTERLISIMECQAYSILALIAMEAEH
nr:uncharacterized protein LOC116836831 [Chelonoidis abingdonii]